MINNIVSKSTIEDLGILDDYLLNDKLDCQTIQEDFDILKYCNRKDFVLLNTYNGSQYVSIVANQDNIEIYNDFFLAYTVDIHYMLLDQIRDIIINKLIVGKVEIKALLFLDKLIKTIK